MENKSEDEKMAIIKKFIFLTESLWREQQKENAKLNERISILEGKTNFSEIEKSLADIAETLRRKS